MTTPETSPVVLVTGGSQRIGASLCRYFHEEGFAVIIHYNHSKQAAETLCKQLNAKRLHSCEVISADLGNLANIQYLAKQSLSAFGRIDVVINNASTFFPTPLQQITEDHWDNLFTSNLKAPLFLNQSLANELAKHEGCIINITDIHAERPLKNYAVYCAAKAGLTNLTKSLARELAPTVRVNAIAPGAILWPEGEAHIEEQKKIALLARIPLQRTGEPNDIAKTAVFLAKYAPYITGQIINVDGGRSLMD